MEPIVIILLVGMILVYFAFYRPAFILKPARERKQLIAKFEQTTNLNLKLIADLQQYAQRNNLLDKPFMEEQTFRKKIAELEVARDQLFSEENHDGLRALNTKKLDMELMSKSLDDQLTYHQRIQNAFNKYITTPIHQ
jgi:hypothetical protein